MATTTTKKQTTVNESSLLIGGAEEAASVLDEISTDLENVAELLADKDVESHDDQLSMVEACLADLTAVRDWLVANPIEAVEEGVE